jgi:hypothetical protein
MANAVTEQGDAVLSESTDPFSDQGARRFAGILEDGTLVAFRGPLVFDDALSFNATAGITNAGSSLPILAATFGASAGFQTKETNAPAAIAALTYSVLTPTVAVGAVVAPAIVGQTYSVLTPAVSLAPLVLTPPIVTMTMEIAAGVVGAGGGLTVSQDAVPQIRVLRVVSRYAFAILSVEDGLED